MAPASKTGDRAAGFSLMEMLLVLAIIGALAAVAAPVVSGALTRAKEAALRENLSVMRKLIDDYAADRAEQPQSLQVLVDDGYLRTIPPDPLATGTTSSWTEVPAKDGAGIADVRSSSTATGLNGVPYAEW
jgi:general secretion pathway protein G